jgi:hypothetical protein
VNRKAMLLACAAAVATVQASSVLSGAGRLRLSRAAPARTGRDGEPEHGP